MFSDTMREVLLPNVPTAKGKFTVCNAVICSANMNVLLRTQPSTGNSADTRLPRLCYLPFTWTMAMRQELTTHQSMALSTRHRKVAQKRQSTLPMHLSTNLKRKEQTMRNIDFLLKFSVLIRLILTTPIYLIALILFIPYGIFRGLTEEDIIRDYLDIFDMLLGRIYYRFFKKK